MDSKSIIKDIKDALKQFGEYSYYDKGANEVMHMSPYINNFKKLPVDDVKTILLGVLKHKHGEPFVSATLQGLQDQPFFDELMANDELNGMY